MRDIGERARELFRFFLTWIFCRWILSWGNGPVVFLLFFSGYCAWLLISRKRDIARRAVAYGLIAAYFLTKSYLAGFSSMAGNGIFNFFQMSRISAVDKAAAAAAIVFLLAYRRDRIGARWKTPALWLFPFVDFAWSALFGNSLIGNGDPISLAPVLIAYCGIIAISQEDEGLPERIGAALSSPWALPAILSAGFLISLQRLEATGLDREIYWVIQSFRGLPAGCFAGSWKGNYQFFGNFLPALSYSFDSIFGSSSLSIFLLFSAISTLSLFVLHLVARKIYGKGAAALIVPVILISPFFPLATAQAKEISVQAFLSLLVILMYLTWEEKGGSALPAFLTGLFAGLGMMNKILFAYFLAALVICILASRRRIGLFAAAAFSLGLLIGSLPYAYYLVREGGLGNFRDSAMNQLAGPVQAGSYNLRNFPSNLLTQFNELSVYFLSSQAGLSLKPPAFRALEIVGALWILGALAAGALAAFSKEEHGAQRMIPFLLLLFLTFSTVSYSDIFPILLSSESFLIFLLFAQLMELSADSGGILRSFGAFAICAALFLPAAAPFLGSPAAEQLIDYGRVGSIAQEENASGVYSTSCILGYGFGYHFSFTGVRVGEIRNESDIRDALSGGRILFIRPSVPIENPPKVGYYPQEVREIGGLSDEFLRSAEARGIAVRAVPLNSAYAEAYVIG